MTGKRILIVGGYGVFGRRLAERLAREADLHLIIAGRDGSAASAMAAALAHAGKASLSSAVFDAAAPSGEQLAMLAPDVIVNASGPFQQQDYTLARAAIAAHIHYVDLADARAFVTGIGALDAAAREAGVLVVSGASTVPAISGAVIDHYAPRFQRLHGVDIAIMPGNSFDPGLATTRSILQGLDVAMLVTQNGHQGTIRGWEYIGRRNIPGLGKRWIANCDVPDLELFPKRYTGIETVTFGAGVEVGAFHLGLATLAFLKRIGLVPRPERLAEPLLAIKRRLKFLGSDRGGMAVTIDGPDHSGVPMRMEWHLVAGSGHGPFVPTIAATILARKLARGEMMARGACPCVGLLSLEEIVADVRDLDISAREPVTPLYRRALGARFAALSPMVRALHDVEGVRVWSGRADVSRGTSAIAKLLAAMFALPPDGPDQPLSVHFEPRGSSEAWVRRFARGVFRSTQSEGAGDLVERVGPVRFGFALDTADGELRLRLKTLHVLGLYVPRILHPRIETREYDEGGRYRYDVASYLPWGALLVRYAGWLEPEIAGADIVAAAP